jgi:glutamate--cysteine ligase
MEAATTMADRPLDERQLLEDLKTHAFAPSSGPPRVGIEIEMLVVRDQRAVSLTELREAIAPLLDLGELEDCTPPGSPPTFRYGQISLTFEPGGQIEIVSPPRPSVAQALEDIGKLEMLLDRVLLWRGMRRLHLGMNPWQKASDIPLQTPLPRYRAMHEYFAQIGPEGARMMRLCCAIQINLDTGSPFQAKRRWHLANLMAPVFAGMFANSPMAEGSPSGCKSARSAVWRGVDPSRTGILPFGDGPTAYLDFALNAGVLLQRGTDGYRAGTPTFNFRDWMEGAGRGDAPTLDDWHYHLTTLFPQVRPRGYYELRSVDALPPRWRSVPVALASTLLMSDAACDESTRLLEPFTFDLDRLAFAAARDGLGDPKVAGLAQSLMRIAQEHVGELPDEWLSVDVAASVAAFDELYTARGRCPADDIIDNNRHASGARTPWR